MAMGHGIGEQLNRFDCCDAEQENTEQNNPGFPAQKCQCYEDQAMQKISNGLVVQRPLMTRSRTVFHRSPRRLFASLHLG